MNKTIIVTIIIILGLINFGYSHEEITIELMKVKAVVTSYELERYNQLQLQHLEAEILGGYYKGQKVAFDLAIIEESKHNMYLSQNSKIILQLTVNNGLIETVEFIDIARDFYLYILFLLFFIFLLIFGGYKGFRSFIALIITALCVLKLFIPMVMKGYSFTLSTVLVSLIIVTSSFVLISGFSKKSLTAILGTIGGTIVSGLLAIFFGSLIQLSGINDDTPQLLLAYSNIDFRGLLYSGITIGVLGAAMDVSMTITSVIHEIKKANPQARISYLMLSGLAVGKDIMATMTNTLILAYAGTSLPLLFLLFLSKTPAIDIINSQYIAAEIIRSLCGSIGLLFTIPITSIIAALNR